MSHLSEIGMNYFAHMVRAFLYAFHTFVTTIIFVAHGVFPFMFCKTGSSRTADLYWNIKAGDSESDRILVRFNTKHSEDSLGRNWRVLVNGRESLAHNVYIQVPCETIVEPIETGEIKYHFLCWGKVRFTEGHIAVIE